jgi:hypothetical protein
MKRYAVLYLITSIFFVCALGIFPNGQLAAAEDQAKPEPEVRINGTVFTPELMQEFEAFYGVKPVPGDYWYDARSGLYGAMGQQAAGMMMPGHTLGEMPENASNGNTGVFMNGRNLTVVPLLARRLRQLRYRGHTSAPRKFLCGIPGEVRLRWRG